MNGGEHLSDWGTQSHVTATVARLLSGCGEGRAARTWNREQMAGVARDA